MLKPAAFKISPSIFMLKQLQFLIILFLTAGFIPGKAFAQFPYSESFMNSTAPEMNLGGTAILTSGNGDTNGNGYLRLTTPANSQAGYAFNSSSFPSAKGISVSFEYYTYGGDGADGISFFLFDAAVADASFNIGSYGGGLGYTNVTSSGLSRGYLAVGLDEYGNFSDAGAGGSGGTGRVVNSVTIRGAYNDTGGNYYMLTTVPVQTNYGFTIGGSGSTRPATGGSGYRKAFIDIVPHSGAIGYDITVKIQYDAVSAPVTVISNYYYNKAAPADLKFGFAASTGGSTNYHEIRNAGVTLPAGTALSTPTQTNQTLTTCSDGTGTVNISSGFTTTNTPNGTINTASVDLDPATAGIQTSFTVALKGAFTSDGSGNITFTPLNSTVTGSAVGSFTVADNYGATSNTATITATINPLPTTANAGTNQTVTAATPTSVTLSGNSPAVGTGSWSLESGPATAVIVNAALNNTVVNNLNPGTYVFRWTITNTCGTSASDVTVNIIGTQSITFNTIPAKTYGDANFNANATASSGLPVAYTSSNPLVATVDAGGTIHILAAGTSVITAAQTGNSNYSAAAPVQQNLTVNKASLSITAVDQITTYASALPALAISYSGFLNGDTQASLITLPAISTTATTTSLVGRYPIMVSSAASDNYSITYTNGTLSVLPGIQTITFTPMAKFYGDADFAINATASSGLPITYNSSNPAIATVDANGLIHIITAGTVTITALQSGNGNYTATTAINQPLVIGKAALIAKADSLHKTYSMANPVLTISYTGFVNGDNPSSLTTQPTISTTATMASVVGTYPITISGAASNKYNISYQPGTLTVDQQSQAITFSATASSKTYGDADFSLAATASSGLPVVYNSSNPSAATIDAAGTVHILSAGTTTITASQSGNSNFSAAATLTQIVTINKASLTITADNQSKTYGAANPALSLSYTGFVNNESPTNLTAQPTASTTATADAAAGTYPITVAAAASNNYDITYQAGTLTIGQSSQAITLAALPVKTYGDTDFNTGASSSNPALPLVYTSSNPAVATVDASGNIHILSAGTTVITVSQAADNNYGAATPVLQTLTVAKAALAITADNQSRVFGLPNPTFTASYSGFVNGESAASLTTQPTITTTATTTSTAGIYPIMASDATAANYTITNVPGTLTVTNATVNSVSFSQITLYENQPAGTPAGTFTAASLDPNAVYTYSLASGTGTTDNASFSIQGNQLTTGKSLDFEQKASYTILVRAMNQYGLYLDQLFTINISDVNEAPTLAAVPAQQVCYLPVVQSIRLSGITAEPETAQMVMATVSSSNPALFTTLSVSSVSGGAATLNYQLASTGSAIVTVTVQDNGGTANGGTDTFSQSFTLTANEMPVAAIASDKGTQVLKGETVTLTASGGTTYSWDSPPNVSGTSISAMIRLRPVQTTTYQVKVSNASGCSSNASITINVADDYQNIHPANLLTPNGDGKNDTWVVKNIDLYPNNTVSIFDKGGRKLLEVKRYNNDWDGTLNGSPLAEGTYYYVIDFGPGQAPLKGFITILRNR